MAPVNPTYIQQAQHCKDMADRAHGPEQKAAWLDLAGKWLALSGSGFQTAPGANGQQRSKGNKQGQ